MPVHQLLTPPLHLPALTPRLPPQATGATACPSTLRMQTSLPRLGRLQELGWQQQQGQQLLHHPPGGGPWQSPRLLPLLLLCLQHPSQQQGLLTWLPLSHLSH